MNARVLVILLLAGTLSFFISTPAHAQNWGTGQWGGMQACPYPNGIAKGASSEDDELNELKKTEKELREEMKDIKKDIRELDRDKDRYKTAISDVVSPAWAGAIFDHMDVGYNCCSNVARPHRRPLPPPVEPGDDEASPPPPPTIPGPTHRHSSTSKPATGRMPASFDGESQGSRMPAAAQGVSAATDGDAGGEVDGGGDGDFGPDMGQGQGGWAGGDGGGRLCHPNSSPYNRRDWNNSICRNDGYVGGIVCSRPPYTRGLPKSAAMSACSRALDAYRKKILEGEKLSNRLAKIEDELEQIKDQKRDIAREKRENRHDDDGASCPICDAMRRRTADTSLGDKLLPYVPSVLGVGLGALGEYLNYKGTQSQNNIAQRMGWPGQQYTFGSSMIPMATAGFNATAMIQSSRNGAYGCAPSGGFVMGPNGQLIPAGGAFGYPSGMIPGMPNYGGGMFMPGYTPNMMGPYGIAGGSPYPGLGNGFAYPGLNGLPGMQPGFGAGLGVAGGFPGAPFPGAFPGSFPGSLPGAGFPNVLGPVPYPGAYPGAYPGGYPGGYGGFPGFGGGNSGLGAYNPYASYGGSPGYRSAIDGSIASSYIGAGLAQSFQNLQTKIGQFNSIGLAGGGGGGYSPYSSGYYGAPSYLGAGYGSAYGASPVGYGLGSSGFGFGLGVSYAPSSPYYSPAIPMTGR